MTVIRGGKTHRVGAVEGYVGLNPLRRAARATIRIHWMQSAACADIVKLFEQRLSASIDACRVANVVLSGEVTVAQGAEASTPSGGVEVRVHGIGNHALLSALGTPTVETPTDSRFAVITSPPPKVDHELVLINWSRTTRNGPAILWYLAFPFTLINVAAQMKPVGKIRRRVHRGLVQVLAVSATLLVVTWIFAIAELTLNVVDFPDAWGKVQGPLAFAVAMVLVSGATWVRAIRGSDSSHHLKVALAHAVTAGVWLIMLLEAKPSQFEVTDDRLLAFSVDGPTDEQFDDILNQRLTERISYSDWLDPLATVSYLTLFLAVVCGLILLVMSWRSGAPGPLVGSALALVLSASLTVLLASSSFVGAQKFVGEHSDSRFIPVFGEREVYNPGELIVIGRFGQSFATDVLPLLSGTLIVLLAAAAWLVFRPPLPSWVPFARRRDFGLWAHKTIESLSVKLADTAFWMLLWSAVAVYAFYVMAEESIYESKGHYVDNLPAYTPPATLQWVAYGAFLFALGIFFTIRAINRLGKLREVLGHLGDLAGFWPITVQPFGARNYRDEVIEVIRVAVAAAGDNVVVVGHSQGSVLCAWMLRHQPARTPDDEVRRNPAFVTCGSPLSSLYRTLFPTQFDDRFFERARSKTRGWTNVWRETDPIATPLACQGGIDLTNDPGRGSDSEADRPGAAMIQRGGHSNYWIDPRQLAWVSYFLGATTHPPEVQVSPWPLSNAEMSRMPEVETSPTLV